MSPVERVFNVVLIFVGIAAVLMFFWAALVIAPAEKQENIERQMRCLSIGLRNHISITENGKEHLYCVTQDTAVPMPENVVSPNSK